MFGGRNCPLYNNMEKEDQLKLKRFFEREEGKLLMEKFTDVIVSKIDIRNMDGKDPKVIQQSIDMFIIWVEEIFGEIDKFKFNAEIEAKKRKYTKERIFQIEPEVE